MQTSKKHAQAKELKAWGGVCVERELLCYQKKK